MKDYNGVAGNVCSATRMMVKCKAIVYDHGICGCLFSILYSASYREKRFLEMQKKWMKTCIDYILFWIERNDCLNVWIKWYEVIEMKKADRKLQVMYSMAQGSYWLMAVIVGAFLTPLLAARGFSESEIGIISAVRSISTCVFQLVLAYLADKYAKRIQVRCYVCYCFRPCIASF